MCPESSKFWLWRNTENLVTREVQEAVLCGLFVSSVSIYTSETFEPEEVNSKPCGTKTTTSEAL